MLCGGVRGNIIADKLAKLVAKEKYIGPGSILGAMDIFIRDLNEWKSEKNINRNHY